MSNPVIYKFISPSNKIYIGQSWNIVARLSKYKSYSCINQQKLYNSLKKYGIENHYFQIIQELPLDVTQDILDKYEQLYMDLYKDCGFTLLNIRNAGSRGKHSEETKIKLSSKKHTKETKIKISKCHLGIKLNPISIEKRTATRKLKKFKHSEKTKQKISLSTKGINKSDSHKKALSTARTIGLKNGKIKKVFGEDHWNSKLLDIDIIDIRNKYKTGYYTHKKLSKEYKVSTALICRILNNKTRII